MKKIVTLGEIMLRFSTSLGERLSQTNHLNMHYGGAESNVAVALSNFGHDVYFMSKVPDNPLGLAVERHLRSFNVHTDYLLKGGERLGTYYLETGVGGRSAQVTYDRKYSSFSKLTLEELELDFDEVFSNADLFHISGITPALSERLKEMTLYALKKTREHGVMTSFDFNYRAKLWSHKEASETIQELLPYVDICSCGELDAVYLLGMEEPSDSTNKLERLHYYYKNIQEKYPNIQCFSSTIREVLSASSNRLQGIFYRDGDLYQSKVYDINHIVDRVGAGDAFASGILHGILEKAAPQQIVSFATAAAALKHTIHGDCNAFSLEEIIAMAENESGKIVR
ncbi:sugar kinase [Neobacillus cucumis]|uniref:sugar kinase n=1 Tax=Neobacillus cucumis TaxID=1740721 RepID=UPI001964DC04|nr:sugar kinase [Neobacillus cucumis]MBM7654328.1 2-dehydro-3-deoxygluconokinase [Neobacillus cucumis]